MAEVGLQDLVNTIRNQNLGMQMARPTSIPQPVTINQTTKSDNRDIVNTVKDGDTEIIGSLNKIFNVLQQQFNLQNQLLQEQRIERQSTPKEYQSGEGGITASREREISLLKKISDNIDNLSGGGSGGFGTSLLELLGVSKLMQGFGSLTGKLLEFSKAISPLIIRFGGLAAAVLTIGEAFKGLESLIEKMDWYKKYSDWAGPKLMEGARSVGNAVGGMFQTPGSQTRRTGRTIGDTSKPGRGGTIGTWDDTRTPSNGGQEPSTTRISPTEKASMKDAWKMAKETQQKTGIPAELTIAQYGLESSYGKHMPKGSNNPFGIKAKQGEPFVEAMTSEFEGGRMVKKPQKFRKFESLQEAFDAHAELLSTRKRYKKVLGAKTPEEIAEAIGSSGYATDPKYKEKILSTMRSKQFQVGRYDTDRESTTKVSGQPGTSPTTLTTEPNDKNFVSVIDQQQKGAKYRRDPITKSLEEKLSESIRAVYGEGYRGKVYSGGQHGERRTGSHRHDDGGAADLRVVGPKGKTLKGDDLAKLAQYWRARDFGGVGLEMGKGGIHLDERKEEYLKKHGGSYDWSYGTRTKGQLEAIKRGEKGELPQLADSSLVGIAGGYKKDEKTRYASAERVRPEGGKYKEEESEMEETNEPVLTEFDSTSKANLSQKGSLEEAQQKYYEQSAKLLESIDKNTKKSADKSEEKKESETATKEEKSEAEKTMDSLFDEDEQTATKEDSANEEILSNAKKVFGEDAVTNEEILSNAKKVFGEDAVSENDLIANKEAMSQTGSTPFGNMGGIIQPVPGGSIFGQMGNMGGFGQNPFGSIQGVLGGLGSAVGMGAGIAGMGRSMGSMGGIYGAQGAIGGIQGVLGSLGMQSPMLGGLGQAMGGIGGVMSSVEMMKNMGNMGGAGGIMGGIGAASAGVGAMGSIFEAGKGLFGGLGGLFGGGEDKTKNVPTQGRFGQRLGETPKEESIFGSIGDTISNFFGGSSSQQSNKNVSQQSTINNTSSSNVQTQGRFGQKLGETPTIASMGAGSDSAAINAKYAGTAGSASSRGESLEGMSRNIETGKEDRMSSDQPIIVEGGGSGGGGGQQGGGSGTPSPSGVMGMNIEVRDPAMWAHMFEFSRIV